MKVAHPHHEHVDSSTVNRPKKIVSYCCYFSALLAVAVVVFGVGVWKGKNSCVTTTTTKGENQELNDLLTGHKILHHVLDKEAQLKYLQWIEIVVHFPRSRASSSIGFQALFTDLHQVSLQRKRALQRWWTKCNYDDVDRCHESSPSSVLDLSFAPISPIGDAIQDKAEFLGMLELITGLFSRSSPVKWKVRFLALQAQATRMVAGIALSTASIEIDQRRANWLRQLAEEYETLRERVIEEWTKTQL